MRRTREKIQSKNYCLIRKNKRNVYKNKQGVYKKRLPEAFCNIGNEVSYNIRYNAAREGFYFKKAAKKHKKK